MSSRQIRFFLCDFRFGGCWVEYMKNFKMGLVVAILTIGAAMLIVIQYEAQIKLRAENESLTQQLAQLKTDNESLSNRLAATGDSKSLSSAQLNELLKLRGEVGMLHQRTNELGKLWQENQQLRSQITTQNQQSTQLSTEDEFKLNQMHMVDAMTALVEAIKKFTDKHSGQYPTSFDQLKAASDFGATNFAGNVGLNDFVFLNPNTVDSQGKKLILRSRIPIKDPQGNLVWVYGSVDNGVPHTETTTALFGNFDPNTQ